jgi:hypothetical protein
LITVPCSMTFQHRYYLKKASKNMRFDNYVWPLPYSPSWFNGQI